MLAIVILDSAVVVIFMLVDAVLAMVMLASTCWQVVCSQCPL